MVSATLDVKSNAAAVGRNVFVEATCSPWIQFTVGEDDVGGRKEVLLNVEAAEVTESPVVVWSEAVRLLANLGVSVIIKRLLNEH